MKTTRRDFLRLTAAGTTLSFFSPTVFATPSSGSADKVLVVLFLNGGNDAVNTVVPYADSRYRTLRPTLAIPDSSLVHLDDRNALHPSLAPLEPFYASRKLALLNGVGFPTLDRSHFHCRDVWMTAAAADDHHGGGGTGGGRGWLGRYADLYLPHVDSPLTTIAVGNASSLALDAESVLPATIPANGTFDILTDARAGRDAWTSAMRTIWSEERSAEELEMIREQGSETFGAIDLVKTIPPPSVTAVYPEGALGAAFRLAAQVIAGDIGTHAIWINHGGFDTHSAQSGEHTELLTDVAASLAAFQADLDARGLSDRVVVMAWSEFGRRVQENASLGTDHGKAGTVLLLGNTVKGGEVYGGPWDLANLEDGDLPTTVDFRAVYATLIRDWYGNDPMPVLGGHYENLGFIGAAAKRRRRAIG